MYTDNATTPFVPQDGNSMAVTFGLTEVEDGDGRKGRISEGLTKFWGEFGSVSPESPDTVAPFIGGFEVGQLHLTHLAHKRKAITTDALEVTGTFHSGSG